MGIGKQVAKGAVNSKANKALDNAGVVGDVIDKHTSTGPLDKASDSVNKSKDKIEDKTKDVSKDIKGKKGR